MIFIVCLPLYLLTSYGGVRSPDGEIMFLTARSLAASSSFALEEKGWWKGFGVATGRDGDSYSIFGPGQAILLAPLVAAGERINRSGWYDSPAVSIPPSHYVDNGLHDFILGRQPGDKRPHALRFLVSPFNAIISAVGAVVFWCILARLGYPTDISVPVTCLYAFGTLAWPYSGTFFSEPTATLAVLLSFLLLLPARGRERAAPAALALSGLALGAATATHLTAVLFLPFFWLLSYGVRRPGGTDRKAPLRALLFFGGGYAVPAALLAVFNDSRFGSVLETGRGVNITDPSAFDYVRFVLPFKGLYGLLLSSGKGLLLYCPAVIAGFFAWRFFHRRNGYLSTVVFSAVLFRVLFISFQEEWYGGFSLGPRYLVMVIPFLLIPVAGWLENSVHDLDRRSMGAFFLVTAASISQQIYFNIGEIFSYLHIVKIPWQNTGLNWNNLLNFRWELSPLFHLMAGKRGPHFLQAVPAGNASLWIAGSSAAFLAAYLWYRRLSGKLPA